MENLLELLFPYIKENIVVVAYSIAFYTLPSV